MLKQITKPKCLPVSLDQARKHLSVDTSDRTNDTLIEMLIESATSDSQMKTGRIWVESEWEWEPELVATGEFLDFPIVPVVGVKLYDMTPPEEKEPETPPVEGGETGDSGDGDTDSGGGGTDGGNTDEPATVDARRAAAIARARQMRAGEAPDPVPAEPETPAEPEYPEVSGEYLKILYPSLDPMGYPAIGGMTPLQELPEQYRLVLTVGYPVEARLEDEELFDNPTLVPDKTGFADGTIRLVFSCPVDGVISPANFELRKKAGAAEPAPDTPPAEGGDTPIETTAEGDAGEEATPPAPEETEDDSIDNPAIGDPTDVIIPVAEAYFIDGAVELQYDAGALAEGDQLELSFFEGDIRDKFDNFVQPIAMMMLPPVAFTAVEDFALPEPVPQIEKYESMTPSPIKNWILTRVGSLYSQRTEIALRAGKSNDAMFPDEFINNLLNPYKVSFFKAYK